MKRMKCIYALGLIAACLTAGTAFAQAPAQPAKAGAATPANSLGQKYDTKLPIEISSDKLEVLQHDNKAIFTGNVIAVQGKIRLTSDTMVVHYRQKSGGPGQPAASGPPAQPAAPIPGGNHVVTAAPAAQSIPGGTPPAAATSSPTDSMGAISLIEVEGNVFMATPEESAKGDRGDYKVDDKLLHLFGDNVVLTRDKNILRGTELVYNLESGQSVLTNHGSNVGPNGGRVRGVFVPNQDNGKNGKTAKTKKSSATTAKTPGDVTAPEAPPVTHAPASVPTPAR